MTEVVNSHLSAEIVVKRYGFAHLFVIFELWTIRSRMFKIIGNDPPSNSHSRG